MKSLVSVLILAFFTSLTSVGWAQSKALQPVVSALEAGNAKALASSFDTNVEITLPTEEGFYSKAQSEQMVKEFFMKNKPQGFTLMHEGESGGNAVFGIGTLTTSGGSFRTYVYLKQSGGQSIIQKLKFTHE